MRGRKSQQQQQDDEDLDFCCGGDEQQQEDDDMAGASEFDQVSPLPLYYKHGLVCCSLVCSRPVRSPD